MNQHHPSIPPLLLERAALGELSSEEQKTLRERFGPVIDQEIGDIYHKNQVWLGSKESEIALQQIQDRVRRQKPAPRRKSWLQRWSIPTLLTATACIALVIGVRSLDRPLSGPGIESNKNPAPSLSSDGVRLKGLRPILTLHRKRGDKQEQLQPNAFAKAGDLIQISYVAATAKYGVIFSIDGRGQTTLHFPYEIGQESNLTSPGATPLEQSYELDDAPKFERFFFVTWDQKRDLPDFVQQVMTAAHRFAKSPETQLRGGKPTLPADCELTTFLLKKGESNVAR